MAVESQKIARTGGFYGFINRLFEALGWQKPFNITNSATINTVNEMKTQLLIIKNNSVQCRRNKGRG